MKNVLIVVIGNTGSEAEAVRQSLESFGYFVAVKYIGRPNDFVSVLNGDLIFEPDAIILSCHGEEGEILMPLLGENVYEPNEPRGNMSGTDIERYLMLQGKLILNLGCTTGEAAMAKAFSKQNTYVAPDDYIEGNAALFFAISLFYEMSKDDAQLEEAFKVAKANDSETELFQIFQ